MTTRTRLFGLVPMLLAVTVSSWSQQISLTSNEVLTGDLMEPLERMDR